MCPEHKFHEKISSLLSLHKNDKFWILEKKKRYIFVFFTHAKQKVVSP